MLGAAEHTTRQEIVVSEHRGRAFVATDPFIVIPFITMGRQQRCPRVGLNGALTRLDRRAWLKCRAGSLQRLSPPPAGPISSGGR